MWLLGAIIGAIVGGAIHPGLLLPAAVAGGLAGWRIAYRKESVAPVDLQARFNDIEKQLAALQEEVRQLKQPATREHTTPAAHEPASNAKTEQTPITPRPASQPISPPAPEPTVRIAAAIARADTRVDRARAPTPAPLAGMDIEIPAWITRLWQGNPLAKIGVTLLFLGIASGLKLAVEHGLFPLSLRLLLAAALGLGLIVFGFIKCRDAIRPEHRTFGLAIQGGGFACLYLVAYFMLARYAMIPDQLAFGLFALLGVGCILMAARQDGPVLAVLGISGAFLAPVLAASHADRPLGLFLYFALLNTFILAIDWFKSWRVLNVAGFILTLVVGMVWAMEGYEARHYLITQSFLALFLAAYSAMPAATAIFRAPGLQGWRDGVLLFGTPLIGTFLQARLMEGEEYGLAVSALLGSLWYFGLWALLARRTEAGSVLVKRSHLGIAIALLTASVPLAFGAQVTSAFWAIEGTAVLWYGIRTHRRLPTISGLAMQCIAGVALLGGWDQLDHRLPVANDAILGASLLALAGVISSRLLRSIADETKVSPAIPFVWAMLWWLCAGLSEIDRFALPGDGAPYGLLFVAGTVIGLDMLSRLWNWPQLRTSISLLLLGAWAAVLFCIEKQGHPFSGLMVLVLPLALALHYFLLARHEQSAPPTMSKTLHLGAWWLLLIALPTEFAWHADRLAPGVALWPFMAWGIALAAGVALPVVGRSRFWPFSSTCADYVPAGVALPAVALGLLLAWANTHQAGDTGLLALPYLPILNFFDLTLLSGLGALLLLARMLDVNQRRTLLGLILALGFLSLSALAARIAFHWAGIPFEFEAMVRSSAFQALLSVFWTVTAIVTMILGSRRSLRKIWMGGFGLLMIVGAKLLLRDAADRGTLIWTGTLISIAVLVLLAGYFAPVPPNQESKNHPG